MNTHQLISTALCLVGFLGGCSHSLNAPLSSESSDRLVLELCGYKPRFTKMSGRFWIKWENSQSSSPYLPGSMSYQEGGPFHIEVTNPIGGTEAQISIIEDSYQVTVKGQVTRGKKEFQGIPVEWIQALLIGKYPCPANWASLVTRYKPPELNIAAQDATFSYQLVSIQNRLSAKQMTWTPLPSSAKGRIDVQFEAFFDKQLFWKKIQITGPEGKIEVRWKDVYI